VSINSGPFCLHSHPLHPATPNLTPATVTSGSAHRQCRAYTHAHRLAETKEDLAISSHITSLPAPAEDVEMVVVAFCSHMPEVLNTTPATNDH
jgi:hypothetical protein